MNSTNVLAEKATEVRRLSLVMSTVAASGHPTSSLSATDILTVLFEKYFRFDIQNPSNLGNDRLLFSKGHASPLFYSLWAMAKAVKKTDLLHYRELHSDLEGHPTPRLPFVDAATGSLGQGLSISCGIALAALKDNHDIKVYTLLGDGEVAEGSIWEAANFASFNKLSNMIAILDVNRLAQSDETMFGHHIEEYEKRFSAFGWETIVIDGHNFEEIDTALRDAQGNHSKPTIIIAKTIKGKGVSFLEDKENWHGKALSKEDLVKALSELGVKEEILDTSPYFELQKPEEIPAESTHITISDLPVTKFTDTDQVATRDVYGKALANLGKENESVIALDADVKNSTFSIDFKKAFPDRFVECYIAEQNMLGVAVGLSKQGKLPFVSTFAAFLTRAFDQIRMAEISQADLKICGSHAGVSIGEDGPSQMGLEDIAMFAAIPSSTILHPSDAVSAEKLVYQTAVTKGISYLRTLRPKTSILYDSEEEFPIGGSKVLREGTEDAIVIVAAGITVHEALRAHEALQSDGIEATVIDAYSIKPLDSQTIIDLALKSKSQTIITVEDHYYHGGLGDMVVNAVANIEDIKVYKLAVTEVSHSGKAPELLDREGISAKHIVEKVKEVTA